MELYRHYLGYPRLFHRYSVHHIGERYGLLVVGYYNELRLLSKLLQCPAETVDIRFVQRRVNLIQKAERARLHLEHGKYQSHCGKRLFSVQ